MEGVFFEDLDRKYLKEIELNLFKCIILIIDPNFLEDSLKTLKLLEDLEFELILKYFLKDFNIFKSLNENDEFDIIYFYSSKIITNLFFNVFYFNKELFENFSMFDEIIQILVRGDKLNAPMHIIEDIKMQAKNSLELNIESYNI